MTGRTPGAFVITGVVATGLWCCVSCSGPTATSSAAAGEAASGSGDHDPSIEQHLWTMAQQAARSMDGPIKSAQAVESRRAAAVRLTSGAIERGHQQVWVIQIQGTHTFVCNACSRPAGVPAQRGRFLTFIVSAKTFGMLDFGIGSRRADLGTLGAVIDLGGSPGS